MSTDSTVQTRTATEDPQPSRSGSGSSRERIARGIGEVLITMGVLLVLFVVWQLWWTNLDADAAQQDAVTRITQEFDRSEELSASRTDGSGGTDGSDGSGGTDSTDRGGGSARNDDEPSNGPNAPRDETTASSGHGRPPVAEPPGYGQAIGIVYVPRFGAAYARPVMEGTGTDVLDTLGLGRYVSSAMPGEVGNFAVAGHRQTNGKVLDLIHTLVPGDRIHVRTAEGYYTYVFRSSEIVHPSETQVLAPVPGAPGVVPTERVLTLTSCHPRFGSTERFIAYAVLESWRPAAEGPPADIADTVAAVEARS